MYKLGSYREIQNVSWPKEYSDEDNTRRGYYDIALVELTTPLKFSALVKPACLPTSDLVEKYEGPLMVSIGILVSDGLGRGLFLGK